jgi:hypothetical protein
MINCFLGQHGQSYVGKTLLLFVIRNYQQNEEIGTPFEV